MPGRKRWRWIGIGVVVAVIVLLLIALFTRPKMVAVVHPVERTVAQALAVSGQFSGAQDSVLAPETSGVLTQLLVDEGQRVRTGQVVGRMTAGVQAAQLQQALAAARAAEAQVRAAQAQAAINAAQLRQAAAEARNAVAQAQNRLQSARETLAASLAGGTPAQRQEVEAGVRQAEVNVTQAENDVAHAAALAESDAVARAPLEQAQAALTTAEARVRSAEAVAENARTELARMQALYDAQAISRSQLDKARTTSQTADADLRQARAQQEQAAVEVANQQRLLEITRDQAVERAQSALAADRQALEAARARLRQVTEPARSEVLAQQRAELTAAEQNLANVRASGQANLQQIADTPVQATLAQASAQLAAAQHAAQAARAQLVTREIIAPFAGTVTEILSYPGDVVGPGQGMARLSQTGLMQATVDVDERDIALVVPGQRAMLITDAYPDRTIEAQVVEVGAYADPQRGTVEVTIQPMAPVSWVRDGATTDATIIIQEARQHLLIPLTSVIRTGEHAEVMVVVDGRVRQRSVRLGTGNQQGVVVLSGLQTSDLVVRDPLSVQPGERVRSKETNG